VHRSLVRSEVLVVARRPIGWSSMAKVVYKKVHGELSALVGLRRVCECEVPRDKTGGPSMHFDRNERSVW